MPDHKCFACAKDNPERIVTKTDNGWTFNFVERFTGPTERAHGGIAIGALTCPALQMAKWDGMQNPEVMQVSGRLNSAIPLAKPIRASAQREGDQYRIQLHGDTGVIIDGFVKVADKKVEIGSEIQEPPQDHVNNIKELAELADAEIEGVTLFRILRESFEAAGFRWTSNECFGCSAAENALKLHHKIARTGDTWTRWETEPAFTDGGNRLATSIVAAAIDCATLHSVTASDPEYAAQLFNENKVWMTGSYGVNFLRVPPLEIEGGYRVCARYLRQEGRKLFSMSALLDREGVVYAMGEAVLIIFDTPDNLRKMR
jgi:hypothetical protein